jgi:hypothetical protein
MASQSYPEDGNFATSTNSNKIMLIKNTTGLRANEVEWAHNIFRSLQTT